MLKENEVGAYVGMSSDSYHVVNFYPSIYSIVFADRSSHLVYKVPLVPHNLALSERSIYMASVRTARAASKFYQFTPEAPGIY